MAFYNKAGSVLRQSISNSNAVNSHSSMFNAIRCMSTKLFIGGLSFGTDDHSLKEAFSTFGEIEYARVITDRDTGKSRGFGFVHFESDECANAAITSMDGQELNGRNIRVSLANERAPRSSFGGNDGGFRSNRGSNDGY